MKRNLAFILLLVLALVGCAAIYVYPITKEKVMAADFDSTWQATLKALQEGKFPVERADERRGIIQTRKLQVRADVLKVICQGYMGVSGQPSEGEYSLRVRVKSKAQNQTSVRINANIMANIPKYGWHKKNSSGVIEEKIFSDIMEQLGQRQMLRKWF